jgi:hypothetical protein
MKEEAQALLNLGRLPGRLTVSEAASLLGFNSDDLTILMQARLLRALGRPRANSVKYFCSAELERCAKDQAWLGRATQAVAEHWQTRNNRRRKTKPGEAGDLPLAA